MSLSAGALYSRSFGRRSSSKARGGGTGGLIAVILTAVILFLGAVCMYLYVWHWRPRKQHRDRIRRLEEQARSLAAIGTGDDEEELGTSCWPWRSSRRRNGEHEKFENEPKLAVPTNMTHRFAYSIDTPFVPPPPPAIVDGIPQLGTVSAMQRSAETDSLPPARPRVKTSALLNRLTNVRSYLSMSTTSSSRSSKSRSSKGRSDYSLGLASTASRERKRSPLPSPLYSHLRRESSGRLLPNEEDADRPISPTDSESHCSHPSLHEVIQNSHSETQSFVPPPPVDAPSFNESWPSIPFVSASVVSPHNSFRPISSQKISPFSVDFSARGQAEVERAAQTEAPIPLSRDDSRRSRVRFSTNQLFELPVEGLQAPSHPHPEFQITPATAPHDGTFNPPPPPPPPSSFLDFESSSGSERTRTISREASLDPESSAHPLRSKWSSTTLPSVRTTDASVLSLRHVLPSVDTPPPQLRSQWSESTLPSARPPSAHNSHDSDYGARIPQSANTTHSGFSSFGNSPVDNRFSTPSRAPSSPLSTSPENNLQIRTNNLIARGEPLYDSPTDVSELQFRNSADYDPESRRASTGSRLPPPAQGGHETSAVEGLAHPLNIVERVLNTPPQSAISAAWPHSHESGALSVSRKSRFIGHSGHPYPHPS